MRWSTFMKHYRESPKVIHSWETAERTYIYDDITSLLESGVTAQAAADAFIDELLTSEKHSRGHGAADMTGYPFLREMVPTYSYREHTLEIILRQFLEKGAVLNSSAILRPPEDMASFLENLDNYYMRGFLIDIFGITNEIAGLYEIPWASIPARRISTLEDYLDQMEKPMEESLCNIHYSALKGMSIFLRSFRPTPIRNRR